MKYTCLWPATWWLQNRRARPGLPDCSGAEPPTSHLNLTPLPAVCYTFYATCHVPLLPRPFINRTHYAEVRLIPERDLELLESFNGHGHIVLSAYLQLDTPQHRQAAFEEFMRQAWARLEECGPRADCRKAIQEDIEIVSVYLKTNGHRRQPGLAIFSCAAELFWRAYPLPEPVPNRVIIGPRFDLDPLRAIARSARPSKGIQHNAPRGELVRE